jgi:hypothetical protein
MVYQVCCIPESLRVFSTFVEVGKIDNRRNKGTKNGMDRDRRLESEDVEG